MEHSLAKNALVGVVVLACVVGPLAAGIVKIEVVGAIDPVQAEFIAGALDYAAEVEAEFLLIRLETPGGLGISMQAII